MVESLKLAIDGRSLTALALRGWDRYTTSLVQALIHEGIKVTFLHREGQPPRVEHLHNLQVDLLPVRASRGLVWEQLALPKALREGRFTLYHAPAEHGIPFASPCPMVLTVHSIISYSYQSLVKAGTLPGTVADYLGYPFQESDFAARYWRAQVKRASSLLVPSQYCRDELVHHLRLSKDRVHVTPLALPTLFQRAPKSPQERGLILSRLGIMTPYLLYVGGYETHKNPQGLLRVFQLVARERPELSLVMVGTQGVPPALRQLAVDLGIADRVISLANLSEDLPDLYDGAELFVSLSWLETFCLPALEAMSRGLLTVTTAWGALPEVVGNAGWLIDPRDPTEAASTVLDALTAQRVGAVQERLKLGRERVQAYSWEATARATIKVYEELLR